MDLSSIIHDLQIAMLVVVFFVFSLLILWAYAPTQRKAMEDHARIPLRDDR